MSETPTPRFPEAEPYFVGDERTNRERMLAGDWYVSDDPDSARIAAHARTMLYRFERAFAEGEENCWDLLRSAIPGLGDKARLLPPVRVDYGDNIAVGEGTFVNYGLVALDVVEIRIGAHCRSARTSSCSRRSTPWSRRRAPAPWRRPTPSRSGTTCGWAAGSSSARV